MAQLGSHAMHCGSRIRKGTVHSFMELLRSLRRQRFYDGNILEQVLRQAVPLFQIFGAGVGNPGLSMGVLPNQNLQREINGDARGSEHKRRASLGAAKDQELCGTHFHSNSFGFATVIDQSEQCDTLGLQNMLEFVDSLVDRMIAWLIDDAFRRDCCHASSSVARLGSAGR